MSAYGYSRNTTPFIDSLAKKGALFSTAYSHSNWTVPATASLLTSRLPSEHGAGIGGTVRMLAADTQILQIRDNVDTLATILQRAGFRTGFFSANPFLKERFTKGFDRADVRWQPAKDLTGAAQRWLDEQPRDKPFFLYVQYMDLHHPIQPPPPFFHYFKVSEGGIRGPEHGGWSWGGIRTAADLQNPEFRQWRAHHIALYDGALRYIDATVRRLYESLEKTGRAEDTLFIITSDHGEEFWDHAIEQSTDRNNPRPYWGVGHGHTMYEELIRVPLIIYGPSVSENREVRCVVRHIDVAPTVLDLLGVQHPSTMRGRSLTSYFKPGSTAGGCVTAPVVAESPAYGPDSQAVVLNQRKLVIRSDGVKSLFDLRDDSMERNDLAARRPELVTALRAVIDRESRSDHAQEAAAVMKMDEETKRQLRALGYLK